MTEPCDEALNPETAASRPRLDQPNGAACVQTQITEVLSVQQVSDLMDEWDKCPNVEVLMANYLAKKMAKELPPTGNSPSLQEAVDDSKRTE